MKLTLRIFNNISCRKFLGVFTGYIFTQQLKLLLYFKVLCLDILINNSLRLRLSHYYLEFEICITVFKTIYFLWGYEINV